MARRRRPRRPRRAKDFHLFPKLPTELRLEIWSYCIPHRVCELDFLTKHTAFELIYGDDCTEPCQFVHTSNVNKSPPVMTRVCRESRDLALKSGKFVDLSDQAMPWWANHTKNRILTKWQDRKRDIAHVNWTPHKDPRWTRFTGLNFAVSCMRREAEQMSGTGCLMVDILGQDYYRFHEAYGLMKWHTSREITKKEYFVSRQLDGLSSCLVVMRLILIHAPFTDAVATGHFGLLGDAPVQVVDAADEVKLSSLLKLAKTYERKSPTKRNQELQPGLTAEEMRQSLEDRIEATYHENEESKEGFHEALKAIMRPAIMFRLCTQECDRHKCFTGKASHWLDDDDIPWRFFCRTKRYARRK